MPPTRFAMQFEMDLASVGRPRSGASSLTGIHRGVEGTNRRNRRANASEETQDTLPVYVESESETEPEDFEIGQPLQRMGPRPALHDERAVHVPQNAPDALPPLYHAGDISRTRLNIAALPARPRLSRLDRFDSFARYLEPSMPNHVYCSCVSCADFHPVEKLPRRSCKLRLLELGGSRCTARAQTVTVGEGIRLSFWFVHLVMRSRRLSPRHGLPLKELAFTFRDDKFGTRRVAPLIGNGNRDGHLLLRIRHLSVKSWEGFATAGGEYAGLNPFPTCSHQRRSDDFRKLLASVAENVGRLDPGEQMNTYLRKCRCCSSEYRFTFTNRALGQAQMYGPEQRIYYTVLEHYIDFGKCEDTQSSEWVGLRSALPVVEGGSPEMISTLKQVAPEGSMEEQFEYRKTLKSKRQRFGEFVERMNHGSISGGPPPGLL